MAAIPITRAEYEKKFGVKPVVSQSENLDTTPAPIRVTRAEWEQMQKQWAPPKSTTPLADFIPHSTYNPQYTGIGNVAKAVGNIPYEIGKAVENTANVPKALYDARNLQARDVAAGVYDVAAKPIVSGLATLGNTLFGGISKGIEKLSGVKLGTPQQQQAWDEKYNNAYGAVQSLQQMLVENPIATATIAKQVPGVSDATARVSNKISDKTVKPFTEVLDKRAVAKRQEDLYNIETQNAGLRKNMNASSDANASSRARVAEAPIWDNVVSEDGKIITLGKGGAYEQYKTATIAGKESVVKDNLVKEGATVNIAEVEKALRMNIANAGLEGATLEKALTSIPMEIRGILRRADEVGNVPLANIHDAKISTTDNINYKVDSTPTIKYRKAVARTYKEIVEKKSKTNVTAQNVELSKYYKDLEYIKSLDGKTVKGGKLGKYFAQISGNVVGGAVGNAIGGFPGMAAGTVIGGEAARFIKGKTMARSLGKGGKGIPENPVLAEARRQAGLPKEVDLRTPDKSVGAPTGVPKTKEITQLESRIKKNVEAQKNAIKQGLFGLVQELKIVYAHLVEALKAEIARIKKEGNRGFIRVGAPKAGTLREKETQQVSPSTNTTISKPAVKVVKRLDTATKNELIQAIDYLRVGKEVPKIEDTVSRLAEKFGISQDLSSAQIAAKFEKLVEDTKTIDSRPMKVLSKDPLATEALKYPTAEEFVKAQQKAFHGTSVAGIDEIGLGSGPRSNSFMGTTREVKSGAVFFTPDKSVADFFAQNRTEFMQDLGKKGAPTTYERYLNIKNPLDLTGKNLAKTSAALDKLGIDIEGKLTGMQSFNRDLATLIDDKEVTLDELWKLADDPKIVEALKKAGYDGAIFKETGNRGTSYAIFDPKQALTKSQLTDLWKKAHNKK